eukprot:gb/GECG01013669.1/.p1 GENE.gb/GECG01013669.1/~~gb/GECG01013669.1/.p1  ORF type:complete len:423 (+),score=45.95 gb/GECG01013669.1/:1-1269(+)
MNLDRIREWLYTLPNARTALAPPDSQWLRDEDVIAQMVDSLKHSEPIAPSVRRTLKQDNCNIFGRIILRKRIFPPDGAASVSPTINESLPPASLAPQDTTPVVAVLSPQLLLRLLDTMVAVHSSNYEVDHLEWARLANALGCHPQWLSKCVFSSSQRTPPHEKELLVCLFQGHKDFMVQGTWENVLTVASDVFPGAQAVIRSSKTQLEELTYETLTAQQRASHASAVSVDNETMEDADDFQNVAQRLRNTAELRVFLKRVLCMDPSFQGTGWLMDALGSRISREWFARNHRLKLCNSKSLTCHMNQVAQAEREDQTYTYCRAVDIMHWLQYRIAPKAGEDALPAKQPSRDEVTISRRYYYLPRSMLKRLWWRLYSWKAIIDPKYRHALVGTVFSVISAGIIGAAVVVSKRGVQAVQLTSPKS